jgi:hypothetical protein
MSLLHENLEPFLLGLESIASTPLLGKLCEDYGYGLRLVAKFHLPNGIKRKSFTFLIMLASREIWLERNTRAFWKISSMPNVIVDRVKEEDALWRLAGAKHLGSLMPPLVEKVPLIPVCNGL